MAANSKHACSCGRTFSFESVLMRHCKQTGHEPATGPVEEQPRPVMASVQAAAEAARQQVATAPAPSAPAPAPAPAPPAPEPPTPEPEPEPAPAPPPVPAKVAPAPAPPPAEPESAPDAGDGSDNPQGSAPSEEPLIYEAALRVLMAKQSAWQDATPPPPPLRERLVTRFRPQLEKLDRGLAQLRVELSQGGRRALPYLSVILAIPIGLALIWTGYTLARALLTLP